MSSIIIADNQLKKILKVVPHHIKEVVELESKGIGKVSAMLVPRNSHNLYWTDSERLTLEVTSLVSHYRRTIHTFTSQSIPIGLYMGDLGEEFFVVTRNGSTLNMVHLNGEAMSVNVMNAKVGDEDSVSVNGDGSKVYIVLGNRLIAYDIRTAESTELEHYYSTTPHHVTFNRDRGTFFWTGTNGTLYWNNKGWLNLKDIIKDYQKGKEIPLIAFSTILSSSETNSCLVNNGGCSDICNESRNGDIQYLCKCGDGRKLKKYKQANICIPCEKLCPDGTCQYGLDETSCPSKQSQKSRGKSTKTSFNIKTERTPTKTSSSAIASNQDLKGNYSGRECALIAIIVFLSTTVLIGCSGFIFRKQIRWVELGH